MKIRFIVTDYLKKNYEYIIGVTSDFLAERLKIQEKTITEELTVIKEKSFLIGEPETY